MVCASTFLRSNPQGPRDSTGVIQKDQRKAWRISDCSEPYLDLTFGQICPRMEQ